MKKICIKCKENKDCLEFPKNKNKKDGLNIHCKLCVNTQMKKCYNTKYAKNATNGQRVQKKWMKENREDQLVYYKEYRETNRETYIRSRLICGARERSRRKKLEFNLDYEWLDNHLKSNKCPITHMEFNYEPNSPQMPSVDRIDPSKGYIKDNCRIVCIIYNFAKNMWTDKDVMILAESLVQGRKNKHAED